MLHRFDNEDLNEFSLNLINICSEMNIIPNIFNNKPNCLEYKIGEGFNIKYGIVYNFNDPIYKNITKKLAPWMIILTRDHLCLNCMMNGKILVHIILTIGYLELFCNHTKFIKDQITSI